ncbi:MAG TPA: hypothetical protein VFX14_11410 [Methylomirabilota bacterium]|nr:hypothetical protein [Methylomirabilota bacterium]
MGPLAVAVLVLCAVAVTVALVMTLVSLRRVLMRVEGVLHLVEREIRPMAAQLGALTEEFRVLSHQVTVELDRLGVVIRRLDDITTGVARLVAVVSGISRVGQVVGLAGGLRRGLGVFVSRLKSREG